MKLSLPRNIWFLYRRVQRLAQVRKPWAMGSCEDVGNTHIDQAIKIQFITKLYILNTAVKNNVYVNYKLKLTVI